MKTVFKRSKGQTMVPLERLTSKSISLRYLKKYLFDLHEIWYTYSSMYKAGLYGFWDWSDEKWISENFLKKRVFCNFVILQARTVKLSGYVIIEVYSSYISTKLTISNLTWVIWVIKSIEIMERFRTLCNILAQV